MTTARDIVALALKEAGVIGIGQTALDEDINDGFTLFSRMLALWQVKRWLVPGLTDISALANGAISNQIGPGKYYNAMRPDKVLAAYFKQLNTGNTLAVSYPLRPIWSYEDYARLALKNLNSFPQYFFYDGAYPNGNVFVWPVPSSDYEIHLITKLPISQQTSIDTGSITTAGAAYTNGAYVGVALTGGSGSGATADITVTAGVVAIVAIANPGQGYAINDILSVAAASVGGTGAGFTYTVNTVVSNLDTEITLPDFYLEAIHYNLCIRLVSMYQYPPDPVKGKLAKIALNAVKIANAQVPTLELPFADRTGFNIYAPDVRQ